MVIMTDFEDIKLTKEILDNIREIDGFPIGKDEDIIELSDPPYYTACPNPFIKNFIEKYGTKYSPQNDEYHRKPFATDVSEGKQDPIYVAHSYHTKVPHKAIMRYILHYTDPGDIVFDGFAGTGMTGVAARQCGTPQKAFQKYIENELPDHKWGTRKSILCDLSPAATFIAYNYNTPINKDELRKEAENILKKMEKKYNWIYETIHKVDETAIYKRDLTGNKEQIKGKIRYTVWSDVFICSECSKEIVFYEAAFDENKKKIKKEFNCPHCNALLTKTSVERTYETSMDEKLGNPIKKAKQKPVLIYYEVPEPGKKRGKRFFKKPDETDLELIKNIEELDIPYWFPINRMPDGYNTEQPKQSHGITYVHHFYTKRNLFALAALNHVINKSKLKMPLKLVFQSFCATLSSKLARYNLGKRGNGPLSGTLYVSSLTAEANVFDHFLTKLNYIIRALTAKKNTSIITTSSNTKVPKCPNNSIDYIFTDPPFGSNLMYSELNFIWESWLQVFTNNNKEAIVNDVQGKSLSDYQRLMEQCFKENYRILKPGRWMTIVFHNSKNRVWIAIQEALSRARFVVADVRTLDKKQGTFKQVTTTSAVKQDLVISAYKPNVYLEEIFQLEAGTEEGAWAFVKQHLEQLPVYVEKNGNVEIIAERQDFLLFDRMVAFHVQRGITVPLSASEFYQGLKEKYPQRDHMFFTVKQVHEYDEKRMNAKQVEQITLSVENERTAINWLRHQLSQNPQTYQEIQPNFIQQLHKESHEELPELIEILEQNFLKNEKGQWYLPDNHKEADLEKIRKKALLREFNEYTKSKGRLRVFRTEAIREGFTECWQNNDYQTIIEVAEKIPTKVLQEDPTLLMYYDNALMQTQQ